MPYPAAPWHLQGHTHLTLHLIDIHQARPRVPDELVIVPVLPGKTLGGTLLANYTAGSALTYSELIVVPALTGYQGRLGFWTSHIYVDHPDSMAGGRDIWGLPKELAKFTWSDSLVSVSQGRQGLCTLKIQAGLSLPPVAIPLTTGTVFSQVSGQLHQFQSRFQGHIRLVGGQLSVPDHSPLAALPPPWLTATLTHLRLQVQAPQPVYSSHP